MIMSAGMQWFLEKATSQGAQLTVQVTREQDSQAMITSRLVM